MFLYYFLGKFYESVIIIMVEWTSFHYLMQHKIRVYSFQWVGQGKEGRGQELRRELVDGSEAGC